MPKPIAPSSVLSGLRQVKVRQGLLWKGPEDKSPLGGITFSMLSKWLTCRERFRVRYVEGWEPTKQFSHRIEYGDMWHVCEEALAGFAPDDRTADNREWEIALHDYVKELCKKFPLSQQDILHWYRVCKLQFPIYVEHWAKNPDVVNRTPLLSEQVFDVPYTLPSGRVVRLRGKWDSVDLVKEEKESGVYLQENKTKGDIDELALQRQLTWDLQTMMYMIALQADPWTGYESEGHFASDHPPHPLKGVRYNVVRRPLSGGEGTIVQREATKGAKCPKCKGAGSTKWGRCDKCDGECRVGAKPPESDDEYYGRVKGVIDGTGINSKGENYTGPSHWFMRWKFDVTAHDVKRFKTECLDPILEALCNWYTLKFDKTGVTGTQFFQDCLLFGHHWRHPFGCENAVNEYGASDVDEYINSGNTSGLHRRETLFEELQ